ncbi:MAG: ornithine carbamoyltransferase, partial [Nitrospinae bacterium]|nr:ornithine carbamoyltransferase [Nitrospinota bacterium]
MKRDFLSIADLTAGEIAGPFGPARRLQEEQKAGIPHPTFAGQT